MAKLYTAILIFANVICIGLVVSLAWRFAEVAAGLFRDGRLALRDGAAAGHGEYLYWGRDNFKIIAYVGMTIVYNVICLTAFVVILIVSLHYFGILK